MSRVVAVLARPGARAAAPPGVDPAAFAAALAEDVLEVAEGLRGVQAVLAAHPPGHLDEVRHVAWPTTPAYRLFGDRPELELLDLLDERGAEQAVILAGDAPDVPGLLVGKLFSALQTAAVALVPAAGGGLVALAARLPLERWARPAGLALDDPATAERLRAAAPGPRAVHTAPGWHRLRAPPDLAALDEGLEGWEATRSLLRGQPPASSSPRSTSGPPERST